MCISVVSTYSRSRRDVMRLSNKRSPYLFGVATANTTKVTTPNKYGTDIIARMSDWENILLFLSPQVFCSDATLSEDGSVEMTMPWTFSVQSASDITSAWLVVALLSKITQTRTDGDLSFRLVAISCMQAFANRRNWQCWYLRCPILTAAISPLEREQTCSCA